MCLFNVRIRVVAIAVLAVLMSACVATHTVTSIEGSRDNTAQFDALRKGRDLVRVGSNRRAIVDYFDKVIDHYESTYRLNDKQYYAARSPSEALLYAVMATAGQTDVVVLDSAWADAYFLKGYAHYELGELDEAQRSLQQAIALSPQNASYLAELGQLYQTRQEWQEALDTFERSEAAAEFSPDETKNDDIARAWRGIGFILIELNKLDEAEAKFKRCLELNAADEKAKNELRYIEQMRARLQAK